MEMDTKCKSPEWMEQYMYPTAYSLFFIIGFPANCLSLYVAWVLMKKGNNLAVYLINLSVGDLLVIAVVMFNSFYMGSGFLCCISVDRYLAIVFPLHFARVREVRTTVLLSVIIWLAVIVLHVSLFTYTETIWNFCASRMCEEPMIMTATIIRAERRKICRLLFSLLFTYLLAFMPFQVVMFIRGLLEPGNCSVTHNLRDYYMVFVAMTTINSVLDPILYCLISDSAKTEMKRLFKVCEEQFIKLSCFSPTSVRLEILLQLFLH
uniref:G-protein coupled receptors family 1 profile domain-containing protein n=1 Tax=Cyprinus carpio TaxID=7962 RepID=A0A8C2Q4N5_CYPCA